MPVNERPDHWYQREYIRAPERLTENIYTKHWYEFVINFVKDKVVLDVGCGCGGGVKFLKPHVKEVYGFDVQPQVKPLVDICLPSTKFLRSKAFDVVMAIDVIAHNIDDVGFVNEMVRLAKEMIILTTPNWRKFKDTNTLHYREYTYIEWKDLFKDFQYKHFYGCHKTVRRLPISASDHGCRFQAAVVWLDGVASSKVHARNDLHSMFKAFRSNLPCVNSFNHTHLCIPVGHWVDEEDRKKIADLVLEHAR